MARDWLDDSSLSAEEVLATFDALPDGGEMQFAKPLKRHLHDHGDPDDDRVAPVPVREAARAVFTGNTAVVHEQPVLITGVRGDIFTAA